MTKSSLGFEHSDSPQRRFWLKCETPAIEYCEDPSMIVSHRHQFIYMKTGKTASTSLEVALSAFCGPEDIITPIRPDIDAIRTELGYPGPQNFALSEGSSSLLQNIGLLKSAYRVRFLSHMQAFHAKLLLGESLWDGYFKFAFERNPYERVLSFYDFWSKVQIGPNRLNRSLPEFIQSERFERLKREGWHVYAIDQDIVVNRVFLYEQLNESLREIEERLRLPSQLVFPSLFSDTRRQRPPHHEVFGSKERDKIHALFDREFDLFGYERLPME